MKRYFVKFYNEIKQRPLKIPEHLKHNLRNSTSAQLALRYTIKKFRTELPLIRLTDIVKASRAHVKAFYFTPNLISSDSPTLETGLRKYLLREVFDPYVKSQKKYLEEQLFVLDKSLESRRNYLLGLECEKFEKALKADKEKKRLENLNKTELLKYHQKTHVEDVLDGEIDTQLVPVDNHTLISYKGVVKMTSQPGKRARFSDLTNQELANYISYNLLNPEQALQMFEKSLENPAFESNNRARLVQKIALLELMNPNDKRFISLVRSLEVNELSKKNICNVLWALGKIYTEPPRSLKKITEVLTEKFYELVPICNSMNIAYACDGIRKLKIVDKNKAIAVAERVSDLIDQVELPSVPAKFEVPQINIPVQGFSMYFGSQDLTIPKTKVPSNAIFRILKYLKVAKNDQLPYFYKKCAQLLNQVSMFELDKRLLLEGVSVYGALGEELQCDEDIRDCTLNLSQLALSYYQDFTLEDVCSVANAIMSASGFRLSSWFRLLELKAFEGVDSIKDFSTLTDLTQHFIRYYLVIDHGRDIAIEPFVWVFEKLKVESRLIDKIYQALKTKEIPQDIEYKNAAMLGMIGINVDVIEESSVLSIIAFAMQEKKHARLARIELSELVELVNSINDYKLLAEFAVVLRVKNVDVDWGYLKQFYMNNKHKIASQPHRIGLAWALHAKVPVDYSYDLLTITEKKMIDKIGYFP